MILTRIMNLLWRPQWNSRVEELFVVGDKVNPLLVLGHSDRPIAELLDDAVGIVGLALENTSVDVISLLNLTHYNGFKLAARVLEIQVCL